MPSDISCLLVCLVLYILNSTCQMIGWYSTMFFRSPLSPWSTLGALTVVMTLTAIKVKVDRR